MTFEPVDPDVLWDLGMIDRPPANNARYWLYGKGSECDHQVELPINESRLWCPLCTQAGEISQLKKIFVAPFQQEVWHEHFNVATGQVESDRKRMEAHGKAHADKISEELGIAHGFERADYGELRATAMETLPTGKTDSMQQALVSTHDQAVKDGRKDSKGKFVH